MSNNLIINALDGEVDIALLENDQLVELHKQSPEGAFIAGDVFLARVKKIATGLNAAFVDVGFEKDAFLHYLDLGPRVKTILSIVEKAQRGKLVNVATMELLPEIEKTGQIGDVLSVNQQILVQITKEPISTKGPRLTSEVTLAGRFLVLVPFSDRVSVSSKIKSREEKDRLKKLMNRIRPNNFGVIVRTVAEEIAIEELEADLNDLMEKWQGGLRKLKSATPPMKIVGELDKTSAILRDILNPSFNQITVNDVTLLENIKEYLKQIAPDKEQIAELYKGNVPIFQKTGVDRQIKGLFGKNVTMKSGAYLVIEHTEALHVIDVNSGNVARPGADQETNALEVNLEAAKEIARQLRLRDMGGIIVVDFIDMKQAEHKRAVFQALSDEMARDRSKHNVLPVSKFGLIEITRQRARPQMNIRTSESCPSCKGKGEVEAPILIEAEIERELDRVILKKPDRQVKIFVHPILASYLKRCIFLKQRQWLFKYKKLIKIYGMDAFSYLQFEIETT